MNIERVQQTIGRQTVVMTSPPQRIPDSKVVDAPLLGNGDVGIAIAGDGSKQEFFVAKNDFWQQPYLGETREQRLDRLLEEHVGLSCFTAAGPRPVGRLCVTAAVLEGASYRQEQDILNAEVRGTFQQGDAVLKTCSWMQADRNILLTQLCSEGDAPITALVYHHMGAVDMDGFDHEMFNADGALWMSRCANTANVPDRRIAGMLTHVVTPGVEVTWTPVKWSVEALTFTLHKGDCVLLATAIVSDLDAAADGVLPARFGLKSHELLRYARQVLADLTLARVAAHQRTHRQWWLDFWRESLIHIGDPVVEKSYYVSIYILACCIRQGKVPPGLFGNWVTTDYPAWTGSYTVNYNYQSPPWGLYTGNHVAITASYCDPLLDAIDICRVFAREKLGRRGLYMPVELGPWGMVCATLFWSQKSNATYCAVNPLMHFYCTWDLDYAAKMYPYLIETANFWEDDLQWVEGRYVIEKDSASEAFAADELNPLLSLGLIRMLFTGLLCISAELGRDADRRAKWQHILDHLSAFPTHEQDGRTVFSLTECNGVKSRVDNTIQIQPIYPGGQVGLDSDPELLRVARNTFEVMPRWDDFNGFGTYYTAGARLGHDPVALLDHLREQCVLHALPNGYIWHGGGGIEDCSAVPTCLHEMMYQSHEGVLRFFPVWPHGRDAFFIQLRGYGAFVATAQIENDEVVFVVIQSEKGRLCTVQNPWRDAPVRLYRNGRKEDAQRLGGARMTIETEPGDVIMLLPDRDEGDALNRITAYLDLIG